MAEQIQALAPRDKMRAFMDVMRDRIATVLPRHLTPERMAQIVLVEAGRNPKLAECSTASLAACVMLASELGLEPSGPLGKFYLVPRRNKGTMECTALLGYKGLAELARRSGEIARLNAGVVYEAEIESGAFRATLEPPEILHTFMAQPFDRSDGAICLAYATAEMKDGSKSQAILTRSQIEDRRARSAASGGGPWTTDYAAMARKTALRALLSGGLVPLSAESPVVRAIEAERQAERTQPEPVRASGAARSRDLGAILDMPDREDVIDVDEETGDVTERSDVARDEAGAPIGDPDEAAEPHYVTCTGDGRRQRVSVAAHRARGERAAAKAQAELV